MNYDRQRDSSVGEKSTAEKNMEKNNWTLTRVMTRSAWLHVQDAIEIGKFRLYIGNYKPGQGAKAQAAAYIDVDALRVVFQDLALRGAMPRSLYPKQSVEFFGGSEKDGFLEARIVKISDQESLKNPIVIEISTGPGKRNRTGGIQPAGKLESVSILLDRWSARKLAAGTLAELTAYESATVMSRKRASEREAAERRERSSDSGGYSNSSSNSPSKNGGGREDDNPRSSRSNRSSSGSGRQHGPDERFNDEHFEERERFEEREKGRDLNREEDFEEPAPKRSRARNSKSKRDQEDEFEDTQPRRRGGRKKEGKNTSSRQDQDVEDNSRTRSKRRSYPKDEKSGSSFQKTARTLRALRSKR